MVCFAKSLYLKLCMVVALCRGLKVFVFLCSLPYCRSRLVAIIARLASPVITTFSTPRAPVRRPVSIIVSVHLTIVTAVGCRRLIAQCFRSFEVCEAATVRSTGSCCAAASHNGTMLGAGRRFAFSSKHGVTANAHNSLIF